MLGADEQQSEIIASIRHLIDSVHADTEGNGELCSVNEPTHALASSYNAIQVFSAAVRSPVAEDQTTTSRRWLGIPALSSIFR